jgi:nucleoside 2-deoxyribosyltransferase
LKFKQIYLIGSLRNPEVPKVGDKLRAAEHGVFDDWFAGGPIADDSWQEYERGRGRSYSVALRGPAARNVYEFDHRNLEASDGAILVLPAGKSGHLELGYMAGRSKYTAVLFMDGEPERWDVMYQFANDVFFSVDEMLEGLDHIV